MTIYYEEEGPAIALNPEQLAKEVLEGALDYLNCPYECQVNLVVTTDEAIRDMNSAYRGIDRATDVLSFPMFDYEIPGNFEECEEAEDAFDPDSGELILGDIVISKDHVTVQAEEYGHSIRREFAFLIVHSVLHLIGYDHIDEEDRVIMEEKQREILDHLGIRRDDPSGVNNE